MIQNPEKRNLHISNEGSETAIEPIAIIGIGCRFPGGANSPEAYWKLLRDGVDAITEVPTARWNKRTFYDTNREKPGKTYTRWGGFVEPIDQFDAQFFGISPREAARIDPQQRLLLEVAWEALEDAGQVPERLAGSNTSVFVGIYIHDYQHIQTGVSERNFLDAHTPTGMAMSIAANRISYVFDFRGPSIALDTACSSSLVAVHLACRSIWNGESTLALAGGVNLILAPEWTIALSKASMLSPDGRCFSFDARANGYVRGEGAGVVVLKPLSNAVADGDPIYAVIRGSAVNQDGYTKGITVPSGRAQEAALREAYQLARVLPEQVQYIEAHGTGTSVGDPIEANALGNLLSRNRPPGDYCVIGSVKSNIGHLESASGIAGLIKVALSLKHRQIPPNLHFQTPNPKISFEVLRLRVPQTLEPWRNGKGPRLAGINSFGFGGTNAHVVLEEAPQFPDTQQHDKEPVANRAQLLPLSARSLEALQALAQVTRDFLAGRESGSIAPFPDICYTASLHRSHHDHRLALVAHSKEELVENLEAILAGESRPGMSSGRQVLGMPPKLTFVFSGMGPQWWAMGRQLLEEELVFRAVIEQCDHLLRQHASWSLWQELTASEETSRINETQIAQPAIFAVQVALAALWRSWGIIPDAIVGHSVGEVAAAHVAGVLSLEDAVRVIFYRSQVQALAAGKGKMLAVGLSPEEAAVTLAGYEERVAIAAINSPSAVTLSGNADALEEIAKSLQQKQIFCRFLRVDVPYHSPLLEPLKAELVESLQGINPQEATIPLFSTVTGQAVKGSELDAAYWAQNMRVPVLFAAAIDGLIQAGHDLFLEISAHPVLATSISECLSHRGKNGTVLPSLRRQKPEQAMMLGSFGKLYTLGYPVDWHQIYPQKGRFVRLPSYPWQRERYWQESEESQQARLGQPGHSQRFMLGQQVHPLLGCQLKSAQPMWDGLIDQQRLTYLDDHRIQGAVVYPGAAYVEMALASAKETFGEGLYILEDVKFHKALFLNNDDPPMLQLILDPSQTSFDIYSIAKDAKSEWTRHATGKLTRNQNGFVPKQVVLDKIRSRCTNEISKSDRYQQFQKIGFEYGPCFQGIERFWSGSKEALAQIRVSNTLETEVEDYQLHPTILDACFQLLIATVSVETAYLPVQIDRVRVYGRPKLLLWSHARLVEENATSLKGDIQLLDEAGNVLAEIQGLRLQSLEGAWETVPQKTDSWYQYQWELKARPGQELVCSPSDYMPFPRQIAESLQLNCVQLSEQLGRQLYYEVVEPQFDILCAAYILKALEQLGWEPRVHQHISAEQLTEHLGIASQHRRLLGRMLEMLQKEGVLSRVEDQWEICHIPKVEEPIEIWKALIAQFPAYQAELTMLGRCGQQLAAVLRGEVEPLQLIFPERSSTAEHLYQDAPTARIYNLLVQKVIAKVLERLPSGRAIRILEIGAGTGAMTSYVLPKLPPNWTEYVFTDVSPLFTTQAEQKFGDYPFIQYRLLDIETDPAEQGFDAHSFDVILASNVVHATRDLRQTMNNIKQLLASRGLLVLLEVTKPSRWLDLTFGLLKGWWLYTDLDLRFSHPLLSSPKWSDLLAEVGFAEVAGISDTEKGESLQTVILAQGPQVWQQVQPELSVSHKSGKQGSWLIFAESEGVGQQLVELFKERKETPIVISPGRGFDRINANHFQIRPDRLEDIQQVLEVVSADQPTCQGVVHLWSLNTLPPEETTVSSLEEAQKLGCLAVLHLVQVLVKVNWSNSPRLWLVTRGTQTVVGEVKSLSIAQSPLWGLNRVIANEHPALQCTMVDLSPVSSPSEIQSLFDELWSDDPEDEIALRGETRYVHRLTRIRAADIQLVGQTATAPRQPFRLEISKPGVLDNLTLRATARRKPGLGEVEIQIYSAGLNFKDITIAMGMLSDEASEKGYSGRSLGAECAGKVAAVGEGVEGFAIGDEVIAFAPHCFGTYTTTKVSLVVHKPRALSFEEAATIPAVFLTAYYGLNYLARMREGDRILIHAAAGGVGLAAIQVAQCAGAEIFATAGTEEKREFLRALGVEHVMDSRMTAFADEMMQLTGGKGVDIVLNSLAGEAIPKSISILGSYGRFVEIGKRDIYDDSKIGLRPFRNNLSFFAVDIDRMLRERPEFAGSLFRELMQLFADGTFHSLLHRVFPISEVVSAFRYMASAKHIGKIVVSLQNSEVVVPASEEKVTFRADGTYLLSGGLGGFGLAVAQWMVEHGARHLVLMGRSGASSSATNSAIEAMKTAGAEVVVDRADVTQEQQVKNVLANIRRSMPPLRGIIHAAMVLDDALVLQLNWERMKKVMAPKVIGAWNLHSQTLNTPLDFFVLFSSFTSLVGNPGQGNYVAANAFLDALAHHRRAIGLPALTINWGSVGDVGYVAQNSNVGKHLKRLGANPLPRRQVLKKLGELLLQPEVVQTAVVDIDWQRWTKIHAAGVLPRFSRLVGEKVVPGKADDFNSEGDSLNNTLLAVEPFARQSIETQLREQVAKVLGISPSKLDIEQSLSNLGLDSLMAVELRNRLNNVLGMDVPIMKFMQGPSIAQLTAELVGQLKPEDSAIAVTSKAQQLSSVTALTADWIVCPKSNPGASLRLFCFPYAGGSTSVFFPWSDALPPDMEVYAVQLPGGADRLSEQSFTQLRSVVENLAQVMLPYLDKPFAFYGHSLGALIAFELARQLHREHAPTPIHLFVAALYAPHLANPYPSDARKSGFDLIKLLSMLDLPESLLKNGELMRSLTPALKAEISLVQKYTYSASEPLDCPISVFGGTQDKVVKRDHLEAWHEHTRSAFNLLLFPGNHLFLHSDQKLLLSAISQELMLHLNSLQSTHKQTLG